MFAVAALESVTGSLPVLGVALVSAVLVLAAWEQAVLQRQRRGLPGHGLVWPFVGKIGEMVKSPYYFYEELAAAGRVAWTSIGGRYAVGRSATRPPRSPFARPNRAHPRRDRPPPYPTGR